MGAIVLKQLTDQFRIENSDRMPGPHGPQPAAIVGVGAGDVYQALDSGHGYLSLRCTLL